MNPATKAKKAKADVEENADDVVEQEPEEAEETTIAKVDAEEEVENMKIIGK